MLGEDESELYSILMKHPIGRACGSLDRRWWLWISCYHRYPVGGEVRYQSFQRTEGMVYFLVTVLGKQNLDRL